MKVVLITVELVSSSAWLALDEHAWTWGKLIIVSAMDKNMAT